MPCQLHTPLFHVTSSLFYLTHTSACDLLQFMHSLSSSLPTLYIYVFFAHQFLSHTFPLPFLEKTKAQLQRFSIPNCRFLQMKGFIGVAATLLLLLFVMERTAARHIARQHSHHVRHHHTTTLASTGGHGEVKLNPNGFMERRRPTTPRRSDLLRVAGSRLPDCSHACGSCSPCRLVMVSFVCASIAEAESCPMAYRCMCNNKSYPVP